MCLCGRSDVTRDVIHSPADTRPHPAPPACGCAVPAVHPAHPQQPCAGALTLGPPQPLWATEAAATDTGARAGGSAAASAAAGAAQSRANSPRGTGHTKAVPSVGCPAAACPAVACPDAAELLLSCSWGATARHTPCCELTAAADTASGGRPPKPAFDPWNPDITTLGPDPEQLPAPLGASACSLGAPRLTESPAAHGPAALGFPVGPAVATPAPADAPLSPQVLIAAFLVSTQQAERDWVRFTALPLAGHLQSAPLHRDGRHSGYRRPGLPAPGLPRSRAVSVSGFHIHLDTRGAAASPFESAMAAAALFADPQPATPFGGATVPVDALGLPLPSALPAAASLSPAAPGVPTGDSDMAAREAVASALETVTASFTHFLPSAAFPGRQCRSEE